MGIRHMAEESENNTGYQTLVKVLWGNWHPF